MYYPAEAFWRLETEPNLCLKDELNFTELHCFAFCGDFINAVEVLSHGVDINAKDYTGHTALYWAIKYDNPAVAELLFQFHIEQFSKNKQREALQKHRLMQMAKPIPLLRI